MRPAPLALLLSACALLAVPSPAAAQHGSLPWRLGDAAPAIAGLRLGASRATIDSALGRPDTVEALGARVVFLAFRGRGIGIVYSDADSLAVFYLGTRKAGDIGGIRVGDSRDTVVARWGEPSESQDSTDMYQVGSWVIMVQLDSPRTSVRLLGLGRVAAGAGNDSGPYDSTADARQDIGRALRASQDDHKLVIVDFGANWCYDCIVLDRLFDDSTVAGYLRANFRIVRVDVGNFNRNLDVDKSYGDPITNGVPAVVVLSPSGRVAATTKDGSLEDARSVTPAQLLRFLQSWVAADHR